MNTSRSSLLALTIFVAALASACTRTPKPSPKAAIKYEPVPERISTPNAVETRIGTLEYFDGYPSSETVDGGARLRPPRFSARGSRFPRWPPDRLASRDARRVA